MGTLAILLATCNSEKYLEEQLDSLFNQKYLNWKLYIRDDGSTDGTSSIIDRYKKRYDNLILLNDDRKHRGARDSFFWMLTLVDADFYMFCDHDDVWLENKVELTYTAMQKFSIQHPSSPLLVCTDLTVVDENLRVISKSLWSYAKIYPKYITNYKYLAVCNYVTGCTVMINKQAKEIVFPVPDKAPMHDYTIALKVSMLGHIKYLKEATILYRQHKDNELGVKRYPSVLTVLVNKIKDVQLFFELNKNLLTQVRTVVPISSFDYYCHKLIYQAKRFLHGLTK